METQEDYNLNAGPTKKPRYMITLKEFQFGMFGKGGAGGDRETISEVLPYFKNMKFGPFPFEPFKNESDRRPIDFNQLVVVMTLDTQNS